MLRRLIIPLALTTALLVTAVAFYLAPEIDLDVADSFYIGKNAFIAQNEAGNRVRALIYWVPTLVFVLFVGLYLGNRLKGSRRWAPSGRGITMLVLSFALGPGLLVNTVLKDHSHRPRPYQTVNFGGDDAFRPFYTFDGACARNCSFVSGEGAAAFWTIAPALLTPPPYQAIAVAASLLFGVGVGTLRMAFGAHYLSDTMFAALLTWLTTWLVWRGTISRSKVRVPRPSRETGINPTSPS